MMVKYLSLLGHALLRPGRQLIFKVYGVTQFLHSTDIYLWENIIFKSTIHRPGGPGQSLRFYWLECILKSGS